MKLYTEEQVFHIVLKAIWNSAKEKDIYDLINQEKAIELPSEDEIARRMHRYSITDFGQMAAFQVGAKWVIDKIKNQEQ